MLCALRMLPFSQAAIKVNSGSGDPKVSKGQAEAAWECPHRRGVGGDLRLRLFSLPPRRLRRGDSLCLRERPAMFGSQAAWSRPFGATLHRCWVEQLGGASADAQSYWQGRFAACTFVERVRHTGRPRNSWGAAPNPARELRPLTPQGALPLDPFFAPRLERACLIVLTCCLCPESALHMTRCPARHHAPPSPSNPVSDPHTRGLSPPKSSHCPTISAGMSQF